MSGYQTTGGQWVDTLDLTLAAAAARTATAAGAAFEVGNHRNVVATLAVTAASGTDETLDVVLETSDAADGTWRTLGSFAQKTAAGTERKSFPGADRFIRAKWTLGGTDTPSFTFSVVAEAV